MKAKRTENEKWYDDNVSDYKQLCKKVSNLLEELLRDANISYHSITARVKGKDSFLKKCEDKKDPINDIMDIAGIRIIAYIKSDVDKIREILEEQFEIDSKNSGDKAEGMKPNEVGYLSVHCIVKVNDSRSKLREYKKYSDKVCEIQVRTLLQHSWAEIEHDRNYKFSGELPKHLKRQFYLIAGTLELLDVEFQNLSDEIDKYRDEVKESTNKGELDIPIDSTSLFEYMANKFDDDIVVKMLGNDDKKSGNLIIDELNGFGLKSLNDIEKIIPYDFLSVQKKYQESTSIMGMLRNIMLINDAKKYFANAYSKKWQALSSGSYDVVCHYNKNIEKILEENNINIWH